jgi:predicted phage terminase large subunit-like protein
VTAAAVAPLHSEDQIEAALARSSLREFIPMAWPIIEPGVPLQMNWHIEAICEHLEAVTAGEIRRLIVNIPPRSMKSRLISVMWPCWVWLTRPESRWMFASYSGDLSTDLSVDCRLILESQGGREEGGTLLERHGYVGMLRLLGEDWSLARDMNLKTRIQNTRRGSRLATSVTAKATGFGGDYIVADDPHNALEAQSDVEREKVLSWWSGTMSSRGNNPKTTKRVLVMQRLHERDLTGDLIERGGYVHLCLPMEYEPKHPHVTPPKVTLPSGRELAGDPRTEAGELLWPERFGEEEVADLKLDLGSYAASGQLQQRPTPAEGGIFQRAWWRFYDPALLNDGHIATRLGLTRVYTTWDTALKEKTSSDYTVGIAWGEAGPNRYVLRLVRGRWSLVETIHQAVSMEAWLREHAMHDAVVQHYVENAAMGPDLISALKHRLQGVTKLTADVDKSARAFAVTPAIEAGNVLLPGVRAVDGSGYDPAGTPDWVQALVEECSGFPNGANDDQVDALVYGINPRRWSQGAGRVRSGRGTAASRLRRGA